MKRDGNAPCMTSQNTGMAYSILAEIGQMLSTLAERGERGAIDLRSLPMTDADRDQLKDLLGQGEIRVEMELAGSSEVWETAYPGVWWLCHRGADSKIATEEIAITPVPEILLAHPADITAAASRIQQDIESALVQSNVHAGEYERESQNV